MTDPYSVLGITPSADDETIKKAYRKKCKEYHPDLHPDDPSAEEHFKEVQAAYSEIMRIKQGGGASYSAGGQRYSSSQSGYIGIFGKQILHHNVHTGIGALCGQPHADKQLPCMGVVQGASGIRILFFQTVNDLQCQSLPGGKILRHFLANRHCSTTFDKKLRR